MRHRIALFGDVEKRDRTAMDCRYPPPQPSPPLKVSEKHSETFDAKYMAS